MGVRCIVINKFWCKVGVGIEAPDSYKMTNGMYIYKWFKAKGWADKPICAIIGNMEAESGLNPGQEETTQWTSQVSGHGLVQWTPGILLKNYTDSINKNWYNWQAQLQFMYAEYQASIRPGWQDGLDQWISTRYYPYTYNHFVHDKKSSLGYLTEAFVRCYERPNMQYAHVPRRVKSAKKFFNYLKHHAPGDIDIGDDNDDYEGDDTIGGDEADDRDNPYNIFMSGHDRLKKFNYILYGGKKHGYNNNN